LTRFRQAAALIVTAIGVFLALAGVRLRLEGQYGPPIPKKAGTPPSPRDPEVPAKKDGSGD